MLTFYSTKGSPGASTSALHLAALWASEGREVLLIEADPAGGSISHNLGIQFTPGTASFVAAGEPMRSNHLIDHAQDVLFTNLHVMPAPASPTGARGIFQVFSDLSEELRSISENEMAVIIDGGTVADETAASGLTASAAGVVVVCRDDSELSSLTRLTDALAARAGSEAPVGCAVTVGKSPMSTEEWQQSHGLTFGGSIMTLSDSASDLTTFLNRTKRKNRKWLTSLEQVAEALYPYAQPPVSDRTGRARSAEADSTPGTQLGAAAEEARTETEPVAHEPVAHEPVGDDPSVPGETPPYESPPAYHPPAPPMAPAAGMSGDPVPTGQGQPGPEPTGAAPSHYLPPTGWDDDPRGAAPPAGSDTVPPTAPPPPAQPYQQQPPAQAHEQPHYQQPPAQAHEQPHYQQPPAQAHEQPHYQQPPAQAHEQPHYQQPPAQAHEQPHYQQPPAQAHEQPHYQQPPAQAHEQPHYQQPPAQAHEQPHYQQPPAQAHEQPHYQQPPAQAHEQPHYQQPPAQAHEQPHYQQPPAQAYPQPQPPAQPRPVAEEPPSKPDVQPTGSFRDLAAKLHGSKAADNAAQNRGV